MGRSEGEGGMLTLWYLSRSGRLFSAVFLQFVCALHSEVSRCLRNRQEGRSGHGHSEHLRLRSVTAASENVCCLLV